VFEARRLPLDSILSGYRLWFVLLLVGAGVAVFVGRSRIQKLLDRKFHRDRPDAHRVIAEVVAENRRSSVPAEIGARLELQIERALRPTRVDVITLSQAGDLENSRMTIPRGRALASLTAAISDLPVDVDSTPELQDALSLSSAGAGAFRSGMAVPVRASDNRILGLLLLGRRRSEVAYSPEDRLLLSTIANAVGPSLEMRLLEGRAASPAEPEGAYECPECSRVFGPIGACGGCACVLAAAPVPLVLANKFEIEARLGAGSMGIVYQALDSQLGRRVAVKTLPRLDPESVVRLRTEARMMAAAAHPNVAIVFGLETWRGTPMLIVELLGRSTLADRIAHGGAMEAPRVGEIGIALSDALARAHGLGVLHRDIKPQNVGFSGGGDPKLMDFGLARIVADGSGSARAVHTEQSLRSSRATQGLVGTPLYLSPEALRGEPPDVSFDLWSLSITLYEAVTGTLPVERRGWAESARAILNASIRPASEVSDCPPSLSKALADFLSGDRTRRPASADQMRQRLRDAVAEM
jgi:hypothetical protein